MAKLINLFTFSGAIGDLVGCHGPNGFYLRSRPRKPVKPPTVRQLEARAKLVLAMEFLRPLREIIYLGFGKQVDKGSKTGALNRAAAGIIRHAVVGNYPKLAIDPARVQLSMGNVMPLADLTLTMDAGWIRVSWGVKLNRLNAFGDDVVYLLAYHPEDGALTVGETQRQAGELMIDVAAEPPGSELLVYACVAFRDGSQFSDSQFVGTVSLPTAYGLKKQKIKK
ncbi:hypothetical protein JHJ32_21500 [Parapedobacter sp. ISTM3]|uniref:DUF6266 family protein n=1 Tax=Parapedobacter sp. ISTM3 TaxID=2800130 RepID=UPI001907C0EB|nr:DUF6266 family protein [Parapedobacter sp. ISTM3]MBK1442590.1 hypothetical protein [Parapedobacter sp. ISTM3]